jgi:hypothetical protein
MDLRRGGDVVRIRLRLRYVAAQRGTSALPWRSGYSDTSSPRSSKLGLVPTANSPGPGSQTSLFPFLYVNVVAFKKSLNILSLPLADFIAPANCSSWELRLRQFMALGGTDVAVAPSGGRHIAFFSHVDLPFHSLRLRDTGAFGPGF